MEITSKNNKLIRKTILAMFGGSLAAMITTAFAQMADTLLAGIIFGKYAVAAVAVGLPIINIFQALTQTIVNGASIKMNIAAGKGKNEEVRHCFAVSIFFTVLMGLLFILVCQFFAVWLVRLFGGSPEVAETATWYLRGASGCIIMGTLNLFLLKTLALFGRQKVIFRAALTAILLNIVFSLFFIKLLPENMAIMGLGMGTWFGGFAATFTSYLSLKKYNLSLKFKFKDVRFSELKEFFQYGLPSSGNNLADGVISGVVNNLIVGGFENGVIALSMYTAVKTVAGFATTVIHAINLSAAPLFGIMYGSRDKNGIVRAYKESLRLAMIVFGICAALILSCSPLLAKVYDMQGVTDFYIGLAVCVLVYLPLTALVRINTQLFEAMEKPVMGFMYSCLPDSVIFPILLALLLPVLGYNGMWIAYSLNAIPFMLALYLIRSVKNKTLKLSFDRIFCLDKEIRDNVPKIDISISSDNRDVTFISKTVYDFLIDEGVSSKTAHTTALCLEELAADFVEHSEEHDSRKAKKVIMDIKLFSDEDKLRTIIRNEASMHNPLDFELDNESFRKMGVKLAQKLAHSINYSYVYKMNIVTIDINK